MAVATSDRHSTARLGPAWLALTVALVAHVVDEALTDFLSVYYPLVSAARERWTWFPMPTFTFDVWLIGLIVLVGVLLCLTPLAYRDVIAVRMAASPYAAIMLLNGVGHLVASVYFWRWMPGATTAPVLLATSVWLLRVARSR